ncbi:hypothetical protein L7F22_035204 [Adiantum nelumboides]|nr:hypothetical protein [Adiantum nelumboides]
MTFGEQLNFEEASRQLNMAIENGINFIDSAEMYPVPQNARSQGKSEEYVGQWLKQKEFSRDKVFLATKSRTKKRDAVSNEERWAGCWHSRGTDCADVAFVCCTDQLMLCKDVPTCWPETVQKSGDIAVDCWGCFWIDHIWGPSGQMTWIRGGPLCLDGKNIMDAVNGSLKRLQTDYIDLYQLHWPDRYVPMFGEVDYDPSCKYSSVPLEEQLEALSSAVSLGKVRHVGVSNETPFGVMEYCRLTKTFPKYARIITIQNAYNLLCRTFDGGLAECCYEMRVSLLAYSPLAMGLLSGKYCGKDGGPSNARLNLYRGQYSEAECRYNLSKPNVMPAVKAYVEIAQQYNVSPVALAIGFVLRHPLAKSVVIGATSRAQLQEILDGSQLEMTPQMMQDINQVHNRFPNPCP